MTVSIIACPQTAGDVEMTIQEKKCVHIQFYIFVITTRIVIRLQIYLVDFGLATRYVTGSGDHKEYKEDPRKVHDGTIEFTSRDAHKGVGK